MNIKRVFIISTALVLLLLLIACTTPPLEEKVTFKQVEPSQVVLPQVGHAVGPLEVQGNTEGSFLVQIMNQMVAKLKGNISSE